MRRRPRPGAKLPSGLASAGLLAVGLGAACGGHDPGDPGTIRPGTECRAARQILEDGRPELRRPWALRVIGTCRGGAGLVADLWTDPPASLAELEALYHTSARLADGRVWSRAFDVAADPGARPEARVAALGVVAAAARPDLTLDLANRRPLDGMTPREWDNVWGTVDHPVRLEGETPLPSDAAARAATLATALAEGDGDAFVRDAAWWLVSLFGLGG